MYTYQTSKTFPAWEAMSKFNPSGQGRECPGSGPWPVVARDPSWAPRLSLGRARGSRPLQSLLRGPSADCVAVPQARWRSGLSGSGHWICYAEE